MATVHLDRVSKLYAGCTVKAVDELSLEVADGELLVLVGPSGCGKSTTLRMIAGLETVTAGNVLIGDRQVNHLPPKDRDVSMVFQDGALYPHMTVRDNMAFGLKMHGLPKREIDARALEAAGMLGIEHLLDRKPRSLSGGERQRVAVGRAMVRRPHAFLLDEPLAHLDARLRTRLRAAFRGWQRSLAATVVYVTHDQQEALSLGDRIAVMDGGRLQQCGLPRTVHDFPANRFVAEFVGDAPMSFLAGRLVRRNGKVLVDCGAGWLEAPMLLGRSVERGVEQVAYGIRADALTLAECSESRAQAPNTLEMTVTSVELLGSEKNVFLRLPRVTELVARVDGNADVSEGQRVSVTFDVNRAHLFEPGERGMNLGLNEHGTGASEN